MVDRRKDGTNAVKATGAGCSFFFQVCDGVSFAVAFAVKFF